jgi:dTDP-glucose 4,6-dehydratase
MQTILVTGGAGFIGSNFLDYFLKKYKDYSIVNLDLITYAGDLENLIGLENNKNYTFVQGDISDRTLVEELFEKYSISNVIHFAAESHVDNSISGPGVFVKTNVFGTFVLLDVANKYWGNNKENRFHHISTDEVYGSLGEEGLFTENTSYAPNSPYSASKASSDMMVRSYFHTYGLNIVITNCSNNYGPKQHDEKLIPTIVRNAIKGLDIPIYGNGSNIRDWLFVSDHCSAIDLVFHNGKKGEVYNIGADQELSNNEIADLICRILDEKVPKECSYKKQLTFVEDRKGHDFRYAIDSTKIKNQLSWRKQQSFKEGLHKTIDFYLKKYQK